MRAMKEPTFRENKSWKMPRACSVCGFEINDEFSSKHDSNLCAECGKEVCFVNRKHKVVDGYCTQCGKHIADQVEYQRWVNSKLPFCDAKIQKAD